jgi:hypothetical protein
MTNFTEDSDIHRGQSSSPELPRNIKLEDVTTGTSGGVRVFSFWGEANTIGKARSIIPQIKNAAVTDQIEKLLLTIRNFVRILQDATGSVINIPPLRAYVAEDDAAVFEWIFPDFRVGFNIEPNPEESGWHIVSNEKLDKITASGPLGNMDATIQTLFAFILRNI